MTRIAVVDHGAGNLVSIAGALERVGASVILAERPGDLDEASGVVLPGVGSTGAAMRRLEEAGFVDPLRSMRVPLLGICVGMQLLFERSEEDGASCLALLPGEVRRLAAPKLPHIGWNEINLATPADPVLAGLDGELFYFVHTYAPVPTDPGVIAAEANYGAPFAAAVRSGHIMGVQFHPERSGEAGLRVLSAFVHECEAATVVA